MSHKKRPIGVTLLAVLAGLAALAAIVHTLQLLHLFPIRGPLGEYRFFAFDLVGAIIWGVLAAIYIWLVRMLWSVDVRAWLFLVMLALLNLIMAGASLIGGTSWQALGATILVNGLVLIYCLLPGTKAAFEVDALKQPAPAPIPAAKAPEKTAVSQPAPAPMPEPKAETVAAVVENVDIGTETAVAAAAFAIAAESDDEETEASETAAAIAAVEAMDMTGAADAAVEEVEEPVEMAAVAAAEAVEQVEAFEDMEETMETAVEAAPLPTPAENVETAVHASPGESAKFRSHVDFIEGIGPVYGQKLHEAGIDSPKALLEAGATRQGRDELVEKTGISYKLIMKWVHAADLYRVKGVGSEYAELLDTAGVNSVLELAQRNPVNLHQTLVEVNEEKHLVRETPSVSMVTNWVEQAKELPRVISH